MSQGDFVPTTRDRQEARATRRAALARLLAADELSIVDDLAAVGVAVSSVYDFVGNSLAPDVALPVLVRHLAIEHHARIREGIIRALGIPNARQIAFEVLRDEYCKEKDPSIRWVIANALSGMARFKEVAELPGIAEFAPLFPKR